MPPAALHGATPATNVAKDARGYFEDVERVGKARRVTDVAAVSGYDPTGDRICLDPLTSRVTTDAEGGVP